MGLYGIFIRDSQLFQSTNQIIHHLAIDSLNGGIPLSTIKTWTSEPSSQGSPRHFS
jgi:hypothetical protein